MRRSIATVSLSGTLEEKLKAIAAAHFGAIELFESDLVSYDGPPREVRQRADDLGLSIDLYQPFRDLEAVPDDLFQRNLDRAERKFDVMDELGAPMLLVCSNASPRAIDDDERAAAQLCALAERAARRNLRVTYEALAWGTHVRTYSHAWRIVQRAAHPHLGLTLDTFHTLALADDPSGIAAIPGERIFFFQVADAPRLGMDVLSWSRHFRCFPGQGDLDLAGFLLQVLRTGYTGPLSLEVFNDEFRASDPRQNAVDAMRSLLYLEEQARARARSVPEASDPVVRHVELFDPPPPPALDGIAFLEFAVDDASGAALGGELERLGFQAAGHHRSKAVTLYRQGDSNLILNAEPASFAQRYFEQHGPSLCATALWTDDEVQALGRSTALLATQFDGRVGPNELTIPAVRSAEGSLLYFIGRAGASSRLFEIDFLPSPPRGQDGGLKRVDHLALALPADRLSASLLFDRAILGLAPQPAVELPDPHGLVRSRALLNENRSVRLTLNVAQGSNTMMARSLSTFSGAGVHHIAFACDDIFATVRRLRAAGARFLAIPDNYYVDLAARFGLPDELVDQLRGEGILYDQNDLGAYFHVFTDTFEGRFFFEIAQRVGAYDAQGEANAPVRMAAQARRYRRQGQPGGDQATGPTTERTVRSM
ncbi:MAG: sugar phosphate isomerase/epimerase and 4-hydroxyphenylpyruvate domain-containing protein [Chloroflexi bacterium]|nr:sugar phosphate isomerase/epimerase and 4-hydroxyphenylpyruvate domain-containing protein [Chloroflexota bacterium]